MRASRRDLERPALPWYLSQQAPTKLERLRELDPVADIARFAESDEHTVHLPLEGAPQERERLVMEAAGGKEEEKAGGVTKENLLRALKKCDARENPRARHRSGF